ncbi:unnamed protein product [Urochloa humidicola]
MMISPCLLSSLFQRETVFCRGSRGKDGNQKATRLTAALRTREFLLLFPLPPPPPPAPRRLRRRGTRQTGVELQISTWPDLDRPLHFLVLPQEFEGFS